VIRRGRFGTPTGHRLALPRGECHMLLALESVEC
jgi:hypothetical protein